MHRDPKTGTLVVVPEVLDDLYHLSQLIRPKDRVRAVTFRTAELSDDVERRGKAEKKRMTLTLDVEDVVFQDFSDRLRVHGVILEGPQDLGAHHTFSVEADGRTDYAVTKKGGWPRRDIERLERAEKDTRLPVLYILAIEDDEATLAAVHHYGVREVSTLTATGVGKMYKSDGRTAFLTETLMRVTSVRPPEAPLIVVGPGWTRERFIEALREKHPDHARGVTTEPTGQAGMTGVHEAVRRGVLERVVRDHAVARDASLFERFLSEVAQDSGLAAYGPDEVLRALGLGAVEELLLTEDAVRDEGSERLLRLADETATNVHVIADAHEAGKRLAAFGGKAALLRFRLD